jgi:hypothetical protein
MCSIVKIRFSTEARRMRRPSIALAAMFLRSGIEFQEPHYATRMLNNDRQECNLYACRLAHDLFYSGQALGMVGAKALVCQPGRR